MNVNEDYKDLERKYHNKLEKDTNFKFFLDSVLEEYFREKEIIDYLFDIRDNENRLISNKEVEIMEKDELIYTKLLALCGREKKEQLDEIISLIEENKQDLMDLYIKEFYKMGIKDGKALRKLL